MTKIKSQQSKQVFNDTIERHRKLTKHTFMKGLHSASWSSGKIPRCGGFTDCLAELKFMLDMIQFREVGLVRGAREGR